MEENFKNILLEKSLDYIIQLLKTKDRDKVKNHTDYGKVFHEYIDKKFKKLSLVSSIVLKNKQIFLDEIYIPLTLSANNSRTTHIIDGYPQKLINEHGLILITDTAGMGKSTIMKKIFLSSVIEKRGIPIFIELRRIKGNESILNEIVKELSLTNYIVDKRHLEYLFETGGFIFFFDGFDEIPNNIKTTVSEELQKFITKNGTDNFFFLTSRPEIALSSFNEFKEFKINHLSLSESFELIRKYDINKSLHKLLIGKLKEKNMKPIHEFLTNPLLTSLLFLAFEHKQTIPLKKHLFYRQVYDANFENHDLTKGDSYNRSKLSNLQSDDFHRILRHIGYQCFKLQKIEFEKDKLLELISNSKDYHKDLEFREANFLSDLILAVPLFVKDGNYYKWSHRSIQEYFAAQFIFKDSKDEQKQILERIYNHNDIDYYINTLELYYDIDYKSFREVIEYNLLKGFIKFYNTKIKYYNNLFNKKEFIKRVELIFLKEIFLVQDSSPQINDELIYAEELSGVRNEDSDPDFQELSDDILLKLFSKRKPGNKCLSKGVNMFPRHGLSTFYIVNDDKKLILLEMLYSKGKKYIKHFDYKIDFYVKINLNEHEQDKIIKLDLTPGNPFNRGDNFRLTSQLIETDFPYVLDYEKSLDELNIIIKDKEHDKKSLIDF